MDINYYKKYEPIFGAWHIIRLLGEGSYGKVFEMQREDFGVTYKAALKTITVPASETELRDAMADGMDEQSAHEYYNSFVQDIVKEFALMSKLKGNSNVVSYENHSVIEHKDGIGWDILIQMELLTPLNEYTTSHNVTRKDVIQLGIDMCKALELCQKHNIIHRDVKPENIFISDTGDYKLGDFGIARTVEKTTSGLSKKGTYTYMAPEIYKGEAYGSTVDIYSLGIVMYRLLNDGRTPFLPAYPAPITHGDRERALAKRFGGTQLPPPKNADGRLAEIVLRACAYSAAQRYTVTLRMREDLEAILYSKEESAYIYPSGDDVPQRSKQYIQTDDNQAAPFATVAIPNNDMADTYGVTQGDDKTEIVFNRDVVVSAPKAHKKKQKIGLLIGLALFFIAATTAVVFLLVQRQDKQQETFDTAYRLYQENRFSDCAIYSQQALSDYADSPELLKILASADFELGEYDAAASLYKQLAAENDDTVDVENLRDYAVCLARTGRFEEAATVFVMLTEQRASADVTSYVLGQTYYAKGDYANAVTEFENVIQISSDETLLRRCYNSLAETYREQGAYQQSIDLLTTALAKPEMATNPVMHEMLGLAYYQRWQQSTTVEDAYNAAKAFEQSIRLGIQKEYLYTNAAYLYFMAGYHDDAQKMLTEMQTIYSDSYQPDALRAVFEIYSENEKPEDERDFHMAEQYYRKAASMVTSDDDQTYMQMLETLIAQLKSGNWL